METGIILRHAVLSKVDIVAIPPNGVNLIMRTCSVPRAVVHRHLPLRRGVSHFCLARRSIITPNDNDGNS